MTAILTRNDIISGIHEVITRLRDAGSAATIQIVGGAAIALTIDEDRPATVDVDGPITPLKDVATVAAQIATERGWPIDWVNDRAKIFLPDGMGRTPEWVTLYDQDEILVQVASPAMLLANSDRLFPNSQAHCAVFKNTASLWVYSFIARSLEPRGIARTSFQGDSALSLEKFHGFGLSPDQRQFFCALYTTRLGRLATRESSSRRRDCGGELSGQRQPGGPSDDPPSMRAR